MRCPVKKNELQPFCVCLSRTAEEPVVKPGFYGRVPGHVLLSDLVRTSFVQNGETAKSWLGSVKQPENRTLRWGHYSRPVASTIANELQARLESLFRDAARKPILMSHQTSQCVPFPPSSSHSWLLSLVRVTSHPAIPPTHGGQKNI